MDNETLNAEPNDNAVVKFDGPTPGTWRNDRHSTFVWSEFGNVCACGDPHASGYVGYTPTEIDSQYLGAAVANARLIAAAPDLLLIAKRVAVYFEGTEGDLGNDALAAIAKATGAP